MYENGHNGFKISNVRVHDLYESMVAQGYPMMTNDFVDYNEEELRFDKETGEIYYTIDRKPDNSNEVYCAPERVVVRKVKQKSTAALAGAKIGSGHDNFLKGILVSFDVRYPVYWSPQFQRYHFSDIISSSSTMHCLTRFDLDKSFSDNTPEIIIKLIKKMIAAYNKAYEHKYLNPDDDVVITETDINNTTKVEMRVRNTDTHSLVDRYYTIEEYYKRIVAACPQGLMKTMRITTNALQLKTMISQRKNHKLSEWRVFCNVLGNLEFWDIIGYKPLNVE